MLKKITAVFVAACLIFGFAGCAKNKENNPVTDARLKIVCTIFPQYDFIRAITKDVDGIELKMLLAPGDESHSYSATLSDISAIDSADLFVYVGGENDEWVDDVLKTSSPGKAIALTELVETLEESDEGILSEEEEEEEEEGSFDEHVWTSLKNAQKIVSALADTLCELDSENAAAYRQNAVLYGNRLSEIDAQFTELFANAENKTIVIADRNPFRYFCEDYGIHAIAAFAGCSSNNEIPLAVQNELIKAIQENGLKYVYVIELNTSSYADSIAAQTGTKKLTLNSCHNLTKENFESGKTFADLMEENYQTLQASIA